MPAYYRDTLAGFLTADPAAVLAALSAGYERDGFPADLRPTVAAWRKAVAALRATAADLPGGWPLLLEYPIPRRSKRIDAVVLAAGLVCVLEFKTGAAPLTAADARQVEDYALDLRDFHAATAGRPVLPVLVGGSAPPPPLAEAADADAVKPVHRVSPAGLAALLAAAADRWGGGGPIGGAAWDASAYRPTPGILDAAAELYAGHGVEAIATATAGADDLRRTTAAVRRAVAAAEKSGHKAAVFVTGVPGAGKTLAGLSLVHDRAGPAAGGVFLSGNGPLVRVLTEALARDHAGRGGAAVGEAQRRAGAFVQNVHAFLREHEAGPPPERVVVFDEAQRAWDAAQSGRKFGRPTSEPEQLLGALDRRPGWAVLVALVGVGQEINTGEAGLSEWGRALAGHFPDWKVAVTPGLAGELFPAPPAGLKREAALHLGVSRRSPRAGRLAEWVDAVLAGDAATARRVPLGGYPVRLTRSLAATKRWLRATTRGTRRCGLVASSGGRRLRADGLDVTAPLDEADWFLRPPGDVRASPFLELPATEFAVQGLELDRVGVCWDADLRMGPGGWECYRFAGTAWRPPTAGGSR